MRRGTRGFTLIELAVVVVLLGLLVAGALAPLGTQIELRDRRRTEAGLERIAAALYGFAMVHGRLPCPDAVNDGAEDRLGDSACVAQAGLLPHTTLGVGARDAWGRPYRYHVTAATTLPAGGASFVAADDGLCAPADGDLDLCTRGTLMVMTRGDDPATSATEGKVPRTLANQVPAVVWSTGRRNNVGGGDEAENGNGDAVYMARIPSAPQAGCSDDTVEARPLCAFDDLLRWISPTVLIEGMVRSGALP